MKVSIRCKGSHTALLNDLKIIQGDLKQLSDKSYNKLKQQILDEGFIAPFFVWINEGELNLLDGTQRKLTLLKMSEEGIELPDYFPIVQVEADSYKQACKRILALSSQYGSMTKDGLKDFMERAEISFNEVEDEFEFDAIDFDEFKDEFEDSTKEGDPSDDEIPEVEESTYVLEGDLWTLGDHRVLCGDSTAKENVDRVLNNEKIDMVFTDPPYGMNLDTDYSKMPGTTTKYKRIENDQKKFNPEFIFKILKSKEYYIWGADYYFKELPENGTLLIWSKRFSEEENKVFGSAFETCWVYPKRKKEIWFIRGINQQKDRLGVHPTQKPLELCLKAIANSKGKNICDLFLGSGSTLIACEKTNRKCYGMEIDPHYVQVIIERYINYMQKESKEYSISCERGGQTYSIEQIKSMI